MIYFTYMSKLFENILLLLNDQRENCNKEKYINASENTIYYYYINNK